LLVFSCYNNPKVDKEDKKPQNDRKISDNIDLYGMWSLCSIYENGVMTQFNICPKVFLNSNGSGSVGNEMLMSEYFNWTLKKDILTIKHTNIFNSNFTFNDSTYFVSINKQISKIDLVIRGKGNDCTYYL
jgi:hypothetical protein